MWGGSDARRSRRRAPSARGPRRARVGVLSDQFIDKKFKRQISHTELGRYCTVAYVLHIRACLRVLRRSSRGADSARRS